MLRSPQQLAAHQDEAELDHGTAALLVLADARGAVALLPLRPRQPRLELRQRRLARLAVPPRLLCGGIAVLVSMGVGIGHNAHGRFWPCTA